MQMLDLEALEQTRLRTDPCEFVVVPNFLSEEALESVNRDYPAIDEPGNFEPEDLTYGPAFAALLKELNGPEYQHQIARKFGVDLSDLVLQMTARKFSAGSDGNVHNDSKNKVITALIYFNEDWPHEGGKLRLCRSSWDIDNYTAEVEPVRGNLIAFKRSEKSFHGFKPCETERRSIQMYWVKPKRQAASSARKKVGMKKLIKRVLKFRPR